MSVCPAAAVPEIVGSALLAGAGFPLTVLFAPAAAPEAASAALSAMTAAA